MGTFVEDTTISAHSSHSEEQWVLAPGAEFSFHPWLASKVRETLGRQDLFLRLKETRCDDVSCPVTETQIEVLGPDSKQPLYLLRFGRKKEQINKLDFHLSLERKKIFS